MLSIKRASVLVLVATMANSASAQNVEDFLPPVRGGSTTVEFQDKVTVKGDLVIGQTQQDATNAAVNENIKTIQIQSKSSSDEPDLGAHWIRFGSGAGIVATGAAVYQELPNPTAGHIAQRNAYVAAYMNAKAAMLRQLKGVSNNGQTTLEAVANEIHTANSSRQESGEGLSEQIRQAANALLRGYVTYAVQEIVEPGSPKVRTVYVSLASSPKTIAATKRSGGTQEVDKIATGISNVLDEIKQGLVPPVGGRIIQVPGTNQTAFVAFGSAIMTPSSNPVFKRKNKLTAYKIAKVRALDALCGILNGDDVMWKTGVGSLANTQFSEMKTYTQTDPVANVSVEEAEATRQAFQSDRSFSETAKSVRVGVLPPGLQKKTWLADDGFWAISMVVYYPELSKSVAEFQKKMQNPNLQRRDENGKIKKRKPAKTKKEVDSSVKPLPNGKVSSDDEL